MKRWLYGLLLLIYMLSLSLFLGFQEVRGIGIFLFGLLGVSAYLLYKEKQGKLPLLILAISGVLITIAMVVDSVFVTQLTAVGLGLSSLFSFLIIWREKNHKWFGKLGLGLMIAIQLFLTVNVFQPKPLIQLVQAVNGPVVAKQTVTNTGNGTVYYHDVIYPSQYENNKLDIYTTENAKGTIFFIHGGGFAIGDKATNYDDYLFRFVEDGYNAVSVNYELTPDVSYPDPLIQVNEALAFILENADIYKIDTDKIVLSGDSAGGQLSGQLALILTDADYASEVGVVPANQGNDFTPKGYISVAGLLDMPRFNDTGFFLTDWLFDSMYRLYFKTNNPANESLVKQSSVLANLSAAFPPTFLSDGNLGTFTDQAKDVHAKLTELGVDSTILTYENSSETLAHTFEIMGGTQAADEVHQAQLEFLEKVLN